MKATIKEIEEFFNLAILQLEKENTIPKGKEEVIKYIETLGLQINWILRDSDKQQTTDLEQCQDLYSHVPVMGFFTYDQIHYAQLTDGIYYVVLYNETFESFDLDELKQWILKHK